VLFTNRPLVNDPDKLLRRVGKQVSDAASPEEEQNRSSR
jgi:hypothetical protein